MDSAVCFCLAGDGLVFVDYDSAGDRLESDDLGDLSVRGWTERSPSGKGLQCGDRDKARCGVSVQASEPQDQRDRGI